MAPPSMRSTSDAARVRSESTAPRTVSGAGELATPRKQSFGNKLKGIFTRRRSSSAGRNRWGQSLSDEEMEGLVVVESNKKGFGLLRHMPSAATVLTKAL